MTTNKTQGPKVMVDCPRCAGKGVGLWEPDGGVCYLCKGKKELSVDIARSERHLAFLRGKYERTREMLYEDGCDRGQVYEALALITRQGEQRKSLLTLAQEALAQKGAA